MSKLDDDISRVREGAPECAVGRKWTNEVVKALDDISKQLQQIIDWAKQLPPGIRMS